MTAKNNSNDFKTLAEAREEYDRLQESLQEKDDKIDGHQSDLDSAQTKIRQLEKSLNVQDQEIAALKEDIKTANDRLKEAHEKMSQLSGSIKEKDVALQSLESEKATLTDAKKKLQSQVDVLKAEAKTVEEKAAEICADMGVDPVKVTPKGETEQASLEEQFKSIKNPAQQTAFWRKHKERLQKLT